MQSYPLLTIVSVLMALARYSVAAPAGGYADVAAFMEKLDAGTPVTVVAFGGSITMHESGWAWQLTEKMRRDYPRATVRFVNAGISSTGSDVGLFRLKRDVLDYCPDLVLLEFAVNDGQTPDEVCIRNLESIVARLQQSPSSPAIVFVQSATEKGYVHERHIRVAEACGLMHVEMQPYVEEAMQRDNVSWSDFFSDAVHPRENGHEIYADAVWKRMLESANPPAGDSPPYPGFGALAREDLVLDAALIVPNFGVEGWAYGSEDEHGWWSRFFQGSLKSIGSSTVFNIPFYGRTVGVWMLIKNGHGQALVAIDGEVVGEVTTGSERWYYATYVYPELLKKEWHVLSLIPLSKDGQSARARLGYVLAEDQSQAPEPSNDFWQKRWKQSCEKTSEQAGG